MEAEQPADLLRYIKDHDCYMIDNKWFMSDKPDYVQSMGGEYYRTRLRATTRLPNVAAIQAGAIFRPH